MPVTPVTNPINKGFLRKEVIMSFMNYDDRVAVRNDKNIRNSVYDLIEDVTQSAEYHTVDTGMHDDVTAHCMLFIAASLIQISETLVKIQDSIDGKSK